MYEDMSIETSPWRKFRRNDLSCSTPGLVVFEFGVDLDPVAGLEHDRFADPGSRAGR
jgi:hypothetical protein